MILLAIGLAFALLVWVGRRPTRLTGLGRMAAAAFAVLAAAAAIYSALRGGWVGSVALVALSAYLGRTAGVGGDRVDGARGGGSEMSLADARSILGVDSVASDAEIIAAYRRLMLRAHPDHGGSAGLAVQLNAARDRLLRKRP